MTLLSMVREYQELLEKKEALSAQTKENNAAIEAAKAQIAQQMVEDDCPRISTGGYSFTLQEKVIYSKRSEGDLAEEGVSFMWGGYNADDLRETANMFDAYDRAAVTAYQRKTKLGEDELLRLMSETTYLTGREAVEKGFADTLIEDAEPLDIAASADGRSLFVRGRQVHLAPGMFAPDSIPTVTTEAPSAAETHTDTPAQTGIEGGTIMAKNPEELRAEALELAEALMAKDPELAKTLMAEARTAVSAKEGQAAPSAGADAVSAAVQAEQKRIQEIDALAGLYDAETVQAAKYGDTACTAQEMAYRAAQKAAQQGRKFLSEMEEDTEASGVQGVPEAGDPGEPPPREAQTPDQRMAAARAEVKALFGKGEK